MEELGFAGNSGSAFAGTKLVRVDLTSLVKGTWALKKVLEPASHLALDPASPVVVILAFLRVGRGVVHISNGGTI